MQALTQPGAMIVGAIALGMCVAGAVFLLLRRATAGAEGVAGVPKALVTTIFAIGLLAALALFAMVTGAPFDRVAYSGFGLFVGVCTLLRPAWFWEHPRARAVRSVLGDGGTAAFYLVVAVVLLYLGLFTNVTFGRHR